MESPGWGDRYAFVVEWFDPFASATRPFHLSWFPWNNTLELYDVKFKRPFLKRTKVKNISLDDLYIGNSIIIFSRQLRIVDFANEFTKNLMGVSMQKTFAFISPDGIEHKTKILQIMIENGFKICKLKMFIIQPEQVEEMFDELIGDVKLNVLKGSLSASPIVALELVAPNGIEALKVLAGPDDPEVAKVEAPSSIRALFGFNTDKNAIYVALNQKKVAKCIDVAFRKPLVNRITDMSTAVLENSTCCLIKPHAVRAGHLANIISMIEEEGFQISAMEMFFLDHLNAGEFLEVYNGVLIEYPAMVAELLTGGSVALEITHPAFKEETASEFRKFCGPSDPDIARQLRPNTIRAKFGVDKVKNAVHVTDLPEDATLEVEYFFRILQL